MSILRIQVTVVVLIALSSLGVTQTRMPENLRQALWSNPAKALTMLKKNPRLVKSFYGDSRQTPLHIASQSGHLEVVRWLLKKGADPNARSYNDFTPLHLAGSAQVATILIKGGANRAARAGFGPTALQYFAFQTLLGLPNRRQIAEAIRQSGQPLDILSAQCLGKLGLARKMIRAHPGDAKKIDVGGRTPLHIAAYMGDIETATLLMSTGFNVDTGREVGMNFGGTHTPLWDARINRQVEMVQFLCERGADPNKLGRQYEESQQRRVYWNHKPTAEELRLRAAAAEIAKILKHYAELRKKNKPRPPLIHPSS
ncbi:MAG: ankyrin repeat domain-containing protein [Armatimonadetes bacterium]|nr:ankyrin repeat domain-containing protein [Armatimonadota bacterium]